MGVLQRLVLLQAVGILQRVVLLQVLGILQAVGVFQVARILQGVGILLMVVLLQAFGVLQAVMLLQAVILAPAMVLLQAVEIFCKAVWDSRARGPLGFTPIDPSQGISSKRLVHSEQAPAKDDVQQQSSNDKDKKLRTRMVELLLRIMEDVISTQRDSAVKSKPGAKAPSEKAKSETPDKNDSEAKASISNVSAGVDANPPRDGLYDSSIRDSTLQGNDAQHKETNSEPSSSPEPMFTLELKQRRNSENAPACLLEDLNLEYGPQRFDGSNEPSPRPSREDASIENLAFQGDDEQPAAPRGPWALTQQQQPQHQESSSEPSRGSERRSTLESRQRSNKIQGQQGTQRSWRK
ncbi:hypothetical protein P168DRAFT_327283 [Aspergillus campestris IBT 28561]|uniref:Uncharacterized protein n=1 Tax=Aspergillus campestris (strain IBT 28561) TaxID=1392248 RepID=A0A2I1D368_ASPC2|nr:uncharacterized protein P168DRAFT_327283 [Aspergillus campestris IBT 28561]PKY04313.1 hypothetical protein P168DRAFT_327283 [Aspergillus campestris IBT 28561]